jgi:hypothetical protein
MDAIADFIDRVLRARGDQKAEARCGWWTWRRSRGASLYPERLA